MNSKHRGARIKRFGKSSRLRLFTLESRDLPHGGFFEAEELMIGPVADLSAVASRAPGPDDHDHGHDVGELKADPNEQAMGPFINPALGSGGFQLLDGGNTGAVYSPAAITYTTSANGLPQLNSAPLSPTAIYLDFDGDGTNLPYDNDGDNTTFSLAEQQTIVEAWRQIAIYYSMFDVNVTTVKPVSIPMCWQLISNSISGGYAYVGAFPNSIPRGFNQSADARTRVSGIAHEIGHNFALSHQSDYNTLGVKTAEYSSGYTLHGPIMGVDYAQLVHKFTIGHPSYSNSSLQEDLLAIANEIKPYQGVGGDGFRPDDVGNTVATSLSMLQADGYFSGWGIIERPTDIDSFSFTSTGGLYGIYGNPNTPSSLDAKMEIYDAAGVRLATVDHVSNNEANVVMNLPAGTYYVLMTGHDDYADLGAYQISVRPLPDGWSSQDIGTLVTGGYAGVDPANGTWRVGGSGSDIGGTSDSFRFAYIPLTGNGSVTAQVTFVENTNSSAKAGVMIRETLANTSKNAFMYLTPTTASFQYRTTTSGSTTTDGASGTAPYWVRITRTGNTIVGQRSADNLNWSTVSTQTISMASQVYIGLAVTSRNNTHYNQVNDATFSNVSTTGTTGATPPSFNALPAPTGLALSLGTGTAIVANWTAVPGATGYEIYRSDDGVNWGTAVGTTSAGTTTYTNTGLTGGRRHFYRIQALDGSTRSVPSATVSAFNRPSAVTNFSVSSISTSQLVLNWRETNGETGYRIERSTDGGTNWSTLGTVGKNVPSYFNSGLGYATTYSYRVTPTFTDGDGPVSPVITTSTRLNPVTGLAITSLTSTQIDLNWSAVTGATGYRIERSSDGTTYSTLTTVTTPGYSNTGLSPLNEYYYRVAATNQYSESTTYPIVFAATPPSTPLPAPWIAADVGPVGGKGAAGLNGSTFTAIGAGGSIGGTSDTFHFVYQPLAGDSTVTARVASVENANAESFAGIMIRESVATNARSFFLGISPTATTGIRWLTRTASGGSSTVTSVANVAIPEWVRLTRNGATILAERSDDGTTWTAVGSVTTSMGVNVLAGLAVVSGDNSKLNTSTFNNVTVLQANLPPAVLQSTPTGTVAGPVNAVDLLFTRSMDTTSFSVANDVASFTGPAGNLIGQITGFSWPNSSTLRVNVASQSLPGSYSMVFGAQILSATGQPLDQDGDNNAGETVQDRFTASWAIGASSDGFGYSYQPTLFDSNLNLVPGTTDVNSISSLTNTDDFADTINLGTNRFRFYGVEYTGLNQLFVSTNGIVSFGSSTTDYTNLDLTGTPAQQTIAALWDDLVTNRNTTTNDEVLYQFQDITGDSTPDRLVINWRNVHYWQQAYTSGDDGITFQMVLELNTGARSGDIILNYIDLDETGSGSLNAGASATVGIKDVGTQGSNRRLISQNGSGNALVGNGKAVRIFVNRPPMADAGGPYTLTANDTVVLNGLNSVDPDQSSASLNYLWDLDGDGAFGETGISALNGDELGATPTFKSVGMTNPASIALRVIDEFGRQSDDTATINPRPIRVTSVKVNDGLSQRSHVSQLTLTFERPVVLPPNPDTAFTITSGTTTIPFTISVTQSTQTSALLTFASLPDGLYALTVDSDQVSDNFGQAIDGDADGIAGGDYVFNFHRLFGDGDGDRDVDSDDFSAFRNAFGLTSFIFDFTGDYYVGAEDFQAFRERFGTSI